MSVIILNIETATKVCSVALSIDGKIIQFQELNDANYSHAENLAVFIDNCIKKANLNYSDLSAIAISKGPGSYTGLRIGVSTAKGLCYALSIPLISVSTLAAMSIGFLEENTINPTDLLCPMIDARRMEVYAAIFNNKGKKIREIQADIIDENSYSTYLTDRKMYFFGDGAVKCTATFSAIPNATIIAAFLPSARYMNTISFEKFNTQQLEDVAYFEPYYLKDFIAGKPKKLV